MEGRQVLLRFPQVNREQDAAIPGRMPLSRCSTGFSTMHPHTQGVSSILASSGVAPSPVFAALAAKNEEPGGPAVLRHPIAIRS